MCNTGKKKGWVQAYIYRRREIKFVLLVSEKLKDKLAIKGRNLAANYLYVSSFF